MNSKLLIPIALAAGLLILSACGSDAADARQPPAAEGPAEIAALVRTAPPAVEDLVDRISLPAELMPRRRVVLAAEVAGVVEKLYFEEGQRLGAGAPLAEIDTRSLAQALAEAEALERQARLQFERAEKLFARQAITQQQMLDATTNRDVTVARLATARLDLQKSKVRAPWSGRVARKMVEVGDYVVPGQAVAELVDVARLKVQAPAPSGDVPFLSVGAPVSIRVDPLPGEVFETEVTRLGTELDRGARTLEVEAELNNRDGRLKPGMPARLEVPRQSLKDAVLVPLSAVVDLGDADVLYVVEGDRARRRTVELGPVAGDRVVVLSGLETDARVVVEGGQAIADGQLVDEAQEG